MELISRHLFAPEAWIVPLLMGFIGAFVAALLQAQQRSARKRLLILSRSAHERVHAGTETKYYFDADIVLGDPSNIGRIGYWFARVLKEAQLHSGYFDRLAFIDKAEGPVGAISLASFLSWQTKIPAVIVRLRGDVSHPVLRIKGSPKPGVSGISVLSKGEKVLLVTDVLTTGETALEAVRLFRRAGAQVSVVAALFDREEGAPAKLKEASIEVVSFAKKSDKDPEVLSKAA
jgi:orotate phosphoribosyltransferase